MKELCLAIAAALLVFFLAYYHQYAEKRRARLRMRRLRQMQTASRQKSQPG